MPASARWEQGWSGRRWKSSRRRSSRSRSATVSDLKGGAMYVPYDMSKVKVLDLSQNFSMDSPSFAFYEGPTVKWVKRLAFEGVNAQHISSTNHIATHLDSPYHFYDPGPDIGASRLTRCSARPASWTCRSSASATMTSMARSTLSSERRRRASRSSAATSWLYTPAITTTTTR